MSDISSKSVSARSTPEELRAHRGQRSASRGQPRPLSTRMIEGLKTFLWVAPLTILIWVYAEREQLAPLNDVPVPISVRSNSPDRIVTLISPKNKLVNLDLAGPSARLNAIRDTFADARAAPLVLTIGDEIPTGSEGDILVAERLRNEKIFADNAAEISRARPSFIRVRVDRKAVMQVPVMVNPSTKLVAATFDPPTVQIEGPAPEIERLQKASNGPMAIYADLSAFANKPAGHYGPEPVNLFLPDAGGNISFPKTVKADITLSPSAPLHLQSIIINIRFAAGALPALDKYKLDLKLKTLPNVDVVGTPEAIQAIKDNKHPVSVDLNLSAEDLARLGDNTKRVDQSNYDLPPGATVLLPDREIAYTVTERGG
jgi:hypothetical protein